MNVADDPLPDPDDVRLWQNYLESCRRAGVEPVTRDHARELVAEWNETFRNAASGPKTVH